MPVRRPNFHAACLLFPALPDDELRELAADIRKNGLRNPIVTLKGNILDGRNRLKACQLAEVEPKYVEFDGDEPVGWVVSQNLARRHLTASQRAVVAFDLLPLLEKEAKQRQRQSNGRAKKVAQDCATFSENGKAAEHAARIARSSARYVEMVKSISIKAPELLDKIRQGELNVPDARRLAGAEPGVVDNLLSFDEKSILQVAKEIRKRQTAERNKRQVAAERRARAKLPKRKTWKVTSDQKVIKCEAVIADPPYGITNEPWEPDDLAAFTHDWCRRWSKCGADFIATFWSQERLFDGRQWFDEGLAGYDFQQMLVWHANNHCSPKSRQWFKQTWEPIFLYRKKGAKRSIISNEKVWDAELHNLDCHVGFVPQTTYTGHDLKQHPCQKPVSVMRWLINALTDPGEKVASPFCGVAPCGIAAVQLGRRYHGIDIDAKFRKLAEARIAVYGKK